MAVAVVDTFVWQALASVIIPGFTINRVCAASLHLLGKTTRWPLPVRKWATTAIGLSTIPFIITPIDRSGPAWLRALVVGEADRLDWIVAGHATLSFACSHCAAEQKHGADSSGHPLLRRH